MRELKPYLDTWIGVPYVHQGHDRNGVDCIGLVRGFYAELGLDLSEFDVPERTFKPSQRKLLKGLNAAFTQGSAIVGSPLCVFNPITGSIHVSLCYDIEDDIYSVIEACRGYGRVINNCYHAAQITPYHLTTAQIDSLVLCPPN